MALIYYIVLMCGGQFNKFITDKINNCDYCNSLPELYNTFKRPNGHLCKKEFFSLNHNNTMNSGKILLGLLAGIAAGATLGILFAPEKGVETRRKISQKGEDFADELTSRFNSFVEQITERFESIQDEASRVVENGKSALEHTSAEANKMAHSAMQQVKKPNL